MSYDWPADVALHRQTQVDVLGREITYTPASGSPVTIRGILSSGEAAELRFQGAQHALWVSRPDLVDEPAKDDQVTIDSQLFRVADIQRDAGGFWLLLRYIRP